VVLAIAAAALAGSLCRGAPPPSAEPVIAKEPDDVSKGPTDAELVKLAKTWELSLKHYEQSYHDYTCLFVKQERLGSTLGVVQNIEAGFSEQPFSVKLHWLAGDQGADRFIYVAGRNDGKALAHPSGLLGVLLPWVHLNPAGWLAMRTSLRPVTDFGFKRTLEIFLAIDRQALAAGELRLEDGGMQTVEETGRPALLLIRHLPPKKGYPAAQNKVWLDRQWLLPVKVEGYGWDGQLTFRYLFKDVHFNVGLKPADFEP
jgi:hypothetical protein